MAHLFSISKAASSESHAQNEQQVSQDGAEERGLDNSNFILRLLAGFKIKDWACLPSRVQYCN